MISSSGARQVLPGPSTKSATGIFLYALADCKVTSASRAMSIGRESPAGDAFPTLPPSVATFLMAGDAISAMGVFIPAGRRTLSKRDVNVQAAPITSFPSCTCRARSSVRWPSNRIGSRKDGSVPVQARCRAIRSVPPANGMHACAPRRASASASVSGRKVFTTPHLPSSPVSAYPAPGWTERMNFHASP